MYLILLGAPGTGKGTQAAILAKRRHWLHISTGEMLREAVTTGSELGVKAKQYMDSGALVPDDLVINMLVERIEHPDATGGFVLDGFPRNLAQAQALDWSLRPTAKDIDLALHLTVPDEELVRRLGGRWMCRSCGAIYHEVTNPPQIAGRCDKCGGELYQRNDDKPETVRARLEQQKPQVNLLAHYQRAGKLIEVDGTQSVDKVTEDMLRAVDSRRVAK